MSVYFYLGCDTCKTRLPFWGSWAGHDGPLRPLSDDPKTITDFIFRHCVDGEPHSMVVCSEHDRRNDEYECPWQDEQDD